ncbi:secretion monitor [Striga asiatica]|uniref:Secretion monitor n=1 Tax=Striga asiatica TaxID=4170 RepID=A0A5A7QKH6_STRAF|nr:secretion monitor [Striga asiatica]
MPRLASPPSSQIHLPVYRPSPPSPATVLLFFDIVSRFLRRKGATPRFKGFESRELPRLPLLKFTPPVYRPSTPATVRGPPTLSRLSSDARARRLGAKASRSPPRISDTASKTTTPRHLDVPPSRSPAVSTPRGLLLQI